MIKTSTSGRTRSGTFRFRIRMLILLHHLRCKITNNLVLTHTREIMNRKEGSKDGVEGRLIPD